MTLKHSKQAKTIVLRQIEVISSLLGKKVQLDLFGDWLLELNYYSDPLDDDIQRSVVRANLPVEEEELIWQLQNIIDVMYLMKFGYESPHELYFPNIYGEYKRNHPRECAKRKKEYDDRLKKFNEDM